MLLSINILENDSGDVDLATIDLDPSTPGRQTRMTTANGSWELVEGTGTVRFTPTGPSNDSISYQYRYKDGSTSKVAKVTVVLTGDGGSTEPPVAVDDRLKDACYPGAWYVDWTWCVSGSSDGVRATNFTTQLLVNDTSSAGADPATVDLDPATPGIQQSVTRTYTDPWGDESAAMTAVYDPDTDTLTVTPEESYNSYVWGNDDIVLRYTYQDTNGQMSNQAAVRQTIIFTSPL